MVARVAFGRTAAVAADVGRIGGRQAAQTVRGPEPAAAHVDHGFGLGVHQQGERQGYREDLIGSESVVATAAVGRRLALRAVDHVVEVAACGVPEPPTEAVGGLFGRGAVAGAGLRRAETMGQVGQHAQGIVPQGVDFDRFADARRDHPVAHLGVHPGELNPRLAGVQQAVVRVDANGVARPAPVPVDDLRQRGKQLRDERKIAGVQQVLMDGMEVPEGGVHRVVLRHHRAVINSVRKPVGKHAPVEVAPKGTQNIGGNRGTAGGQGQPRQGDHGVAPPIAEPRIAGDDRSSRRRPGRHVPFFGGGRLDGAAWAGPVRERAPHHELVGGQRQVPDPCRFLSRERPQQVGLPRALPRQRLPAAVCSDILQ